MTPKMARHGNGDRASAVVLLNGCRRGREARMAILFKYMFM
jgi:hypothetical protein